MVGHEARAALVSEQDGEARKVETCSACRGYLKSVSTLRAWAADEVALTDLATVDLDLVALERAFERPRAETIGAGCQSDRLIAIGYFYPCHPSSCPSL